jgi:hypothetical protein
MKGTIPNPGPSSTFPLVSDVSTPVSDVMARGQQIRRRRKMITTVALASIATVAAIGIIHAVSDRGDSFTPSCVALQNDKDVSLFNECRAMEQNDLWSRTKRFNHGRNGTCWQLTNGSTTIIECADGSVTAVK